MSSISELWLDLLHRRWRPMLAVAMVALAPALALTALVEAHRDGAIVNGRLIAESEAWTTLRLHGGVGAAQWTLPLPVLTVLAWLAALAVCIPILDGTTVRSALRRARGRVLSWSALGAVLLALVVAGLYATLVAGLVLGDAVGPVAVWGIWAVMIAVLYGLVRLAPALAAMLLDGLDLPSSLRRSIDRTRGRTLRSGTLLIVAGVVVPTLVRDLISGPVRHGVASLPGRPELWAGAATLVEHLALAAVIPVQAALLVAAHRVASGYPKPSYAPMRRWALPGLALLLAVPAAVTTAIVSTNPRHLLTATVSDDVGWSLRHPYAMVVLDDGRAAAVDASQVGVCPDARCGEDVDFSLSCLDGDAPRPDGPDVWMCDSHDQVQAADIRADGAVLVLTRHGVTGDQDARLMWCWMERNRFSMCRWAGRIVLREMPDTWENWSMAVAATPAGGFAAALIGPGRDEQHGEILLLTCDHLDCPAPTARPVLEIDLPNGWYGAGSLGIDVDPATGDVALAYAEPTTGAFWLGGCPAGCPGGPALSPISFSPTGQAPAFATLDVVAARPGPAAVVTVTVPGVRNPTVHTYACNDPGCATATYGAGVWSSAWPVRGSAGRAFIVGTASAAGAPMLVDALTGATTRLAGEGSVLAAAFGPDDRLRLLLRGAEGRPTLVTCTVPALHESPR